MHDIPKDTELMISYDVLESPFIDRRMRLLNEYGFECQCIRCKFESNVQDIIGENAPCEIGGYCALFLMKHVCSNGHCGGTVCPIENFE